MIKKLLFILFFSLLAIPALAQQSEAEREAMYYIRKAYDYSRERKTEEAFKYVKLFETYLDKNLSPEISSDSIAIY